MMRVNGRERCTPNASSMRRRDSAPSRVGGFISALIRSMCLDVIAGICFTLSSNPARFIPASTIKLPTVSAILQNYWDDRNKAGYFGQNTRRDALGGSPAALRATRDADFGGEKFTTTAAVP